MSVKEKGFVEEETVNLTESKKKKRPKSSKLDKKSKMEQAFEPEHGKKSKKGKREKPRGNGGAAKGAFIVFVLMLLIVGGGVFVYNNGKVLMQKRKDNGCWSLHGGCLEIGETVEETARRELKEETGLTAITLEFLGVFSGKDML